MFMTCSHQSFTFTDSYLQYKNLNNFQRRMSTINDPSPPFFVATFGGSNLVRFTVDGLVSTHGAWKFSFAVACCSTWDGPTGDV